MRTGYSHLFLFLSTKYNLPNSHLFCFFQVRHFKNLFPHFPNRPPEHHLDYYGLDTGQKHLLLAICILISTLNVNPTFFFERILGK